MIAALLVLASILPSATPTGRIVANHPFAAIPFIPADSRPGTWIVQMALVGNNTIEPQQLQGYDLDWNVPLLQETGTIQYLATRHLRIFASTTLGRSIDLSSGLVLQVRQTGIVWDVECSVGASWRRLALDTLILSSSESTKHPYVLRPDGKWAQWSQFALRSRMPGTGPWLELRLLPAFPVGDAGENGGEFLFSDNTDNAFALGAFGMGWNIELSRGREATIGFRNTAIETGNNFQLIAQVQGSLPGL